jgi:hypothetical protein
MADNIPTSSRTTDESQAAKPETRDLEKEIRERAYAIWENEGRQEGRDLEHWERAKRQISGEFHFEETEIEGDDEPKHDALWEAVGEHTGSFPAKSDLEYAGATVERRHRRNHL